MEHAKYYSEIRDDEILTVPICDIDSLMPLGRETVTPVTEEV